MVNQNIQTNAIDFFGLVTNAIDDSLILVKE